ncbi:hypothetical protein WJX73_007581 [Symbiochloris irregularis]|uniref:Uncharacterized protein n=1 Tax=Symbiochloris irregularis TaxID=706552 RepID=A0AAW1NRM3_9CHLO
MAAEESAPEASQGPQTAWERLSNAFGGAFARVDPGSQIAPVPPELREWGSNTALAVLAGMMIFGGRQMVRNRAQAGIALQQAAKSAPTKAHAARATAEANTQRLLLTCRETLRGAVLVGSAVGSYTGIAAVSALARGYRDPKTDLALAGGIVGGIAGSLVPNVRSRLLSGILAAVLTASVGVPVGYLDEKVRSLMPDDDPRKQSLDPKAPHSAQQDVSDAPSVQYPALKADALQSVIEQLESGVHSSQSDSELEGG